MTDYKEGDLVDEAKLRRDLADARKRLDDANEEQRAASAAWNEASTALAKGLGGRFAREDELLYARDAKCLCGAPMAYQPDARPHAWDCADVLLGRVGSPQDPALVWERPVFGVHATPPDSGGKQVHERLPFSFWKVKEDATRKTR